MKTSIRIQKAYGLALAFVLWAGIIGSAQARWNPAPVGTVQDWITAAPDGGTVNIPAGTYTENLLVDKNLTLKGASVSATILQAPTDQRVIKVTSGHNLRLESLRVTGGHPTAPDDLGGGVYLAGGSLELDHVQVDTNQASYGGGVFQEGESSSVTAVNSVISDNIATIHGGGIYSAGSASLTSTTLTTNTAIIHGGGMHVNSGTTTLNGGSFNGNQAQNGNGGGLNVNDGLTVTGTTFNNNSASGLSNIAGNGGAITQWNPDSMVEISGATFNANTAQFNGGAVFIHQSFLTLGSSIFTANLANFGSTMPSASGGGVYAGGGLSGSLLYFNGNSAVCSGPCTYTNGGAVYIDRPESGASTINNSTFIGNLAWHGGGVFSLDNVQLMLSNCNFYSNGSIVQGKQPSGYGGGVEARWVHGDHLVFQNNKVLNNGGGLLGSEILLTNSRFSSNQASVKGGGVYSTQSFDGTNLLFDSNDSSSGSALYISAGSGILRHATISRPTRGTGDAIFVNSSSTLELKNSIVSDHNKGMVVSGTLTEDYNLFFNNYVDYSPLTGGTINYGIHDVATKDPLFVNPALGDYHLRWPSPAIGKGTDLGVITALDGRLRLGRADIGAYQFWTSFLLPLVRR